MCGWGRNSGSVTYLLEGHQGNMSSQGWKHHSTLVDMGGHVPFAIPKTFLTQEEVVWHILVVLAVVT